jgi:uncharacterized protein YecA (UPF0149 family)
MLKTDKPYAERIRLGLLKSLWVVIVRGARIVKIRWRFPEERLMKNRPCPCGSGRKFRKCHGA